MRAIAPQPGPGGDGAVRVAIGIDDDVLWEQVRDALTVMIPVRIPRARMKGALADVLVLHAREPDRHTLAEVRQLRHAGVADVRVVLICDQIDSRGMRRSLDVAVNGLVPVQRVHDALPATVAAVLAGQVSVPADLGDSLRRRPLSFREKQIMGLAVLGYTNSQIGGRLYLAESTVKSHLSSSFAKLGVSSRSEAAALVRDADEPLGFEIMRIVGQLDRADLNGNAVRRAG